MSIILPYLCIVSKYVNEPIYEELIGLNYYFIFGVFQNNQKKYYTLNDLTFPARQN